MENVVEEFVAAFNRGDFDALRSLLDADLVAHVTTADGDDAEIVGADAYVASLRSMVTKAPTQYQVALTQRPVPVEGDRLLAMLEIRASRGGRTLHNFSAQLFRFDGALVSEIQMTDAKPRESAAFWE